jgi:hypothetical protein
MKPKINPFWGFLTLGLVLLTLALCVLGSKSGTAVVKTEEDPRIAAYLFFDALEKGNTEAIRNGMENYSSLGLENSPQKEFGQLEWDALRQNCHFELTGVCTAEGGTATQTVRASYLDLARLEDELALRLEPEIQAKMEELHLTEQPAEEGETASEEAAAETAEDAGQEEAAESAAAAAENDPALERFRSWLDERKLELLRELLGNAEAYVTTVELPVTLHFVDGRWLVYVDDPLLTALSGGKL